MKKKIYICPQTKTKLELKPIQDSFEEIASGYLQNMHGEVFPICDGVPDFTSSSKLNKIQEEQLSYYQKNASIYDSFQHLTFDIQNVDEQKEREKMIKELDLKPNSKVLEIACGTGQDSFLIASQLNNEGELFLLDISLEMVKQCQTKLRGQKASIEFAVGNASYLPFPDHYFDAVYSFGGLNIFDNPKASLKEMVRVAKEGARIVVGDESIPPWLKDTEFAKILVNSNPLFNFEIPIELIPVEAREVKVQWLIGGVYYLVSFTVGSGEPKGNFDIPIPGKRGGTLKTRYYGKLEGVSEKLKEEVQKAAMQENLSIHEWLEKSLNSILTNNNG